MNLGKNLLIVKYNNRVQYQYELKKRNEELNKLVIQYQSEPTDKLEMEIRSSIYTLINQTAYGLANGKNIQQDLIADSYIPFKRSLDQYNGDGKTDFASYAMLNIRRWLHEQINILYRVEGISLKNTFATAYAKQKNGEELTNSEKQMLNINTIRLNTPTNGPDSGTTIEDIIQGVEPDKLKSYNNFGEFYFNVLKPLLLTYKPQLIKGKTRPRSLKLERLEEYEMCSGVLGDKLTFAEVAELKCVSKQNIHQSYRYINKRIKEIIITYNLQEYIDELLD